MSQLPKLESFVQKFDAILWAMEVNESLLDEADHRRLRAFGRELSSSQKEEGSRKTDI